MKWKFASTKRHMFFQDTCGCLAPEASTLVFCFIPPDYVTQFAEIPWMRARGWSFA